MIALIFAAAVTVVYYFLLYLSLSDTSSVLSESAIIGQIVMFVLEAVIWAIILKKSKRRVLYSVTVIPSIIAVCSVTALFPSIRNAITAGLGEALILISQYIFFMYFSGLLAIISIVFIVIDIIGHKKEKDKVTQSENSI